VSRRRWRRRDSKYKSLKDEISIVRDTFFFDELGAHFDALLPMTDSILVMLGGSVTLAESMYYLARQHQALVAAGEDTVISALEERFSRLKSLLILTLWLHLAYAEVGRAVVNSGVGIVMT
jgi:hypothetical protein